MRHIFLINPAAGRGKAAAELLPAILRAVKDKGVVYEIHRTVNTGDATRFVKDRCAHADGDRLRFYSVGGEGTLNEVLQGMMGDPNSEIAVIPAGTGNDFARNFGERRDFLDIPAQLDGFLKPVDALKYELLDQRGDDRLPSAGYAINMFNMGFDAEVAATTGRMKRKPFLNGTAAYVAGVGAELTKLSGVDMTVEINGEPVASGDFLLAGAANGRFSGGGFDGSPLAVTDDGLMDVTLVRSMSRRLFLAIVKKYHDGTHYSDPRLDGVLTHYQCREAVFRPKEPMVMAVDGDTYTVGSVKFSIISGGVNLSLPVSLKEDDKEAEPQ